MDVFWQIVGWVATGLIIVSMLQTRIFRLRVINLTGCLVSVVFNGVVGNWPVVGLNAALTVINVVQLWRLTRSRHDPGSYDVTHLGGTDRALAHQFATRHWSDISRYHPVLDSPDDVTTCDDVFLITRGDELVGLMAMRRGSDAVAHVVLDYVTPAYQDTTPGEFVFRGSTALHERGYREVQAPAGPTNYYARIGFTHTAQGYTLPLN